jgi:hypothetical protein
VPKTRNVDEDMEASLSALSFQLSAETARRSARRD